MCRLTDDQLEWIWLNWKDIFWKVPWDYVFVNCETEMNWIKKPQQATSCSGTLQGQADLDVIDVAVAKLHIYV